MNFKKFYINGKWPKFTYSFNVYAYWNSFMYKLYVITTPKKKAKDKSIEEDTVPIKYKGEIDVSKRKFISSK